MPVFNYTQLASALRALSVDAVERANSGHPGMPMGMADVAAVLFADILKFSAANPKWHDRDRFVLSAGHGSMLLYALLHLTGYADFPMTQLKNFRQPGARAAGRWHPEYGNGGGIETTTGPLAQGFANGVGMAIAEKTLGAKQFHNRPMHNAPRQIMTSVCTAPDKTALELRKNIALRAAAGAVMVCVIMMVSPVRYFTTFLIAGVCDIRHGYLQYLQYLQLPPAFV